MQDIKIDSNTIETSKTTPGVMSTVQYKRDFIEQQIINIQKQKDDFSVQRDKEIAECQDILNKMDVLGIITTVQPEPINIKTG